MLFSPLSEVAGRQIIYPSTLLLGVVFLIPCAVARNIGTLLGCRAVDGIFFSAPMTIVGGTLADIWKVEERGIAMAMFSAAPFLGPTIGLVAGGYLSDAKGWRWLYWIQLIVSGTAYLLISFTVPETYAPIILKRRAAKMRKETGDISHVTELELDKRPFKERMKVFLVRPFQLLFREPIVFLISLYMSVLYGLLYMFFVAFPLIYQEGKGYSSGKMGLMFIPLAIGVLFSSACAPIVNRDYLRHSAQYGGKPPAEVRLIPMMFSCWLIPIGLFIFAWTSYPRVSWAGPAMGGFTIGLGFIFLYNSANVSLSSKTQVSSFCDIAGNTALREKFIQANCAFSNRTTSSTRINTKLLLPSPRRPVSDHSGEPV